MQWHPNNRLTRADRALTAQHVCAQSPEQPAGQPGNAPLGLFPTSQLPLWLLLCCLPPLSPVAPPRPAWQAAFCFPSLPFAFRAALGPFQQTSLFASFIGLSSWLCHPCSLPCSLNCCICRSMLAGVPALVDMPSKTRVPCTRKFRTTRHIYIPGLHLRRQCPLTYTMSSQRTSPSNLMRQTFTPIEKL